MTIKVLFFGSVSEITGVSSLELEKIVDIDHLKSWLAEKYPAIEKVKYQISVNKSIVRQNVTFSEGDEIALLPPFAGG